MKGFTYFLFLTLLIFNYFDISATENELLLKNNLKLAKVGDFIVTAQSKNYTILLVRSKDENFLSIEEITVPSHHISDNFAWKNWVEKGANGQTSWILYSINLSTGVIAQTYSFTRKEWISIPQSQNFLSTLLNLHLHLIPTNERKKIGPQPNGSAFDKRPLWQPNLIVEGKPIKGVVFNAWKTHWPKDNSELSGRAIEIYLPQNSDKYPAYFPYWLQISGMFGKAKVRIVDSGSQLTSPALLPQ